VSSIKVGDAVALKGQTSLRYEVLSMFEDRAWCRADGGIYETHFLHDLGKLPKIRKVVRWIVPHASTWSEDGVQVTVFRGAQREPADNAIGPAIRVELEVEDHS
jgi:hypothetical protein